jgi:RNA polymerase sigma-70 factor, ECF subfamily
MITSLVGTETRNPTVRQSRQDFDPAELVEKYGDFLYRFAMMRVRDEFVAEDLVQETLLAALKSIDKFSHRSSARTWLTSILKNKIIDYFRQLKPEESVDFSGEENLADEFFFQPNGAWKSAYTPSEWNADPDKVVENQEFWQIINRCLEMLPKRTAAAFTLREIEGFSGDEVCRTLNISPNNLWVMLHRARLHLRQSIEANFFNSNL